MKTLKKGSCVVFTNGWIGHVEAEGVEIFTSRIDALAYIDSEIEACPGLHCYLCAVTELHYISMQRHKKILDKPTKI